jgi:peptide/nickel transport system permease protein
MKAVERATRASWLRFRRIKVGLLSALVLLLIVLFAVAGPSFVHYDPDTVDMLGAFSAPSAAHLLGTDELGRDVLIRLMHGGRITLLVGVVAMAVAVLVGVAVGLVGGLMGSSTDYVLMRITDTFMAVPAFFIMLIIITLFGTTLTNIVLAIGITGWMNVARVIRAEVFKVRELDYIAAARALGISTPRLIVAHVLPNVMPSVIVSATLGVAWAIVVSTSLSYLGLGVQPPTPSWGNMLTNSQNYFWVQPLLVLYPGVMIILTVLSANFIGDALRDALTPTTREYQSEAQG